MKAILASIKPRHNKNILNLIKLWEIRKKFPKDYVGWVYIYNTKDIKDGYLTNAYINGKLEFITSFTPHNKYRGKVIARFWCDKVEEIVTVNRLDTGKVVLYRGHKDGLTNRELMKGSCLTFEEMNDYLQGKLGRAIHITKLEIFDKPKEISEFRKLSTFSLEELQKIGLPYTETMYKDMATKGKWFLTRAPQSWCYIEV